MEIPKPDINNPNPNDSIDSFTIATDATYTSSRNYAVAIPENDFSDSLVEIRASVLTEIRQKLDDAKSTGIAWILDLLLAIGGVCWGGWLTYLLSNGTYSEAQKFIYGTLLFGLALATSVAYGIYKALISSGRNVSLSDILKLVPDPQKAVRKEQP